MLQVIFCAFSKPMNFSASTEDKVTYIYETPLLQFSLCLLCSVHLMFALVYDAGSCSSGPVCSVFCMILAWWQAYLSHDSETMILLKLFSMTLIWIFFLLLLCLFLGFIIIWGPKDPVCSILFEIYHFLQLNDPITVP